jgi:hypothetical protein
MFEQIGNALVFNVFYSTAGVGKTGLTDVTVDVYKNNALIVTGAPAGEAGGGLYSYTLTSGFVDVAGEYIAVFKTADGSVGQRHVPVEASVGRGGVENLDAPVSTVVTLLTAADVTVISPLSADGGTISVVRGDDYLINQSRQLTFSSSAWPVLTGADPIVLTIRRRKEAFGTGSDPVLLVRTDDVATRDVGGAPQVLTFELTSGIGALTAPNVGDTNDLLIGTASGKFDVEATLATGEIITLVIGIVNVIEDITR